MRNTPWLAAAALLITGAAFAADKTDAKVDTSVRMKIVTPDGGREVVVKGEDTKVYEIRPDGTRKAGEASALAEPPKPGVSRTETVVITPDGGSLDAREAELRALRARIGALEAENQALRQRLGDRGVERSAPRPPRGEMTEEEERKFEREMEAWGRELEKSMQDIGPRIQERMKTLQPLIERRIEIIRPKIEERMRALQPEIERTVRESIDEAIRALEDARRELERSQRETERPR